MTKKAVILLSAFGAVVLVILLSILVTRDFPFADYSNDAVLGESKTPRPSYNEEGYNSGAIDDNTLLTIDRMKLKGIENVLSVNVQDETTARLKCRYRSISGAFKLIMVSQTGKVTTLFDSAKQKSGSVVSVSFPKGADIIRLVGKPVQLTGFSATWAQIDRSNLS